MTPSGTSSEQKPSRLKNSSNTPYKALPLSLPIPREELFHSLAVHYSTCQRSRIYNLAARAKGRKRGKEGGENSMSIPQGEITLLHIGKNFRVRLSLSLSLSLNPGKKWARRENLSATTFNLLTAAALLPRGRENERKREREKEKPSGIARASSRRRCARVFLLVVQQQRSSSVYSFSPSLSLFLSFFPLCFFVPPGVRAPFFALDDDEERERAHGTGQCSCSGSSEAQADWLSTAINAGINESPPWYFSLAGLASWNAVLSGEFPFLFSFWILMRWADVYLRYICRYICA